MKVAIFGAGTMGSGIAQVMAAHGHTVLMYASSVASAQRHKDKLAASLEKKVSKGKMKEEDKNAILDKILVEEKSAAADADLVIECVKEEMATKRALLGELDVQTRDRIRVQYFFTLRYRDGKWTEASSNRNAFLQSGSSYEAG